MANYESESKLEDRMIDQLRRQGYNYIEINDIMKLQNKGVSSRTFFCSLNKGGV